MVFDDGAPCPIHTHITSITYIYKVIDIIYVDNDHMVGAKYSSSLCINTVMGTMYHYHNLDQSMSWLRRESLWIGLHFLIIHIRSVLSHVTVMGNHKDVTPLCCSQL